jgi:hypothetical protein
MSVPHRKHITSPLRAQQVNAIYMFMTIYINVTITILDIIHRPGFHFKHRVMEIGFCLRLQVKPTELAPVDRATVHLRKR